MGLKTLLIKGILCVSGKTENAPSRSEGAFYCVVSARAVVWGRADRAPHLR